VAFEVVLDTCVLYPAHLRDTLLRLSERGLYRPLWTQDIIQELHRNLVEAGVDEESVEHLLKEMTGAFPDALITGHEPLIGAMTCDEKDRHVLAAAVRADASAIITFNLDDFPEASVQPYLIDLIHPDQFLLDAYDLASDLVFDEIGHQASANKTSPRTIPEIAEALARAVDDITVTQSSTVLELRRMGEETTSPELFRAGLRVGRDHIGATINTLLLAYAGASIPLLLLFSLSRLRLDLVANSEVVAVEIVRTLVGSIGLVAAVPITTWLASRLVVHATTAART
jgi:hypothetical protein